MERAIDLIKAVVAGAFVGGVVGIALVTFIGTACLALGVSSHLAIGPVPFMTVYTGSSYGFSSEWGVWLFGIAGAAYFIARVLQGRPVRL
jgi:hypothetical protein